MTDEQDRIELVRESSEEGTELSEAQLSGKAEAPKRPKEPAGLQTSAPKTQSASEPSSAKAEKSSD